MRLAASGVVVTKYALTSWTVKCIDRATGEEIYFNTTLPKGVGSWASEGEAMKAIGAQDRRRVLAQLLPAARHRDRTQGRARGRRHARTAARGRAAARARRRCPRSSRRRARPNAKPRVYDLQLAGSGAEGDLVAAGVLKPLNAKLGQPCFSLGSIAGEEVNVIFAKSCSERVRPVAVRDQSARGTVRRAAAAAEGAHQESRNAAPALDVATA